MRRQLPVSSPVSLPGLVRGLGAALGIGTPFEAVIATLRQRHGASTVLLCDSGTSALVIALRAAVPPGGSVAFPSYSCVDLAAAARYAGVRVRLYDLDPETLSADLDSLEATLRRGVDAVVAAHLYGFPVDIEGMKALAYAHGATLIEDAAQGAGGTLGGAPTGGLGDVSVLSFGRGKGTTSGRGGAVTTSDPQWATRLQSAGAATEQRPNAGWGDLTRGAAQWLLGRPALYGLPAAIPGLHLGEMVYHPAHEPRSISRAAIGLLRDALRADPREVARRRANAAILEHAVRERRDARSIRPVLGAEPGYLRFPVIDAGSRAQAPVLGITCGYPRALFEQDELRPSLHSDEPEPLGGRHLRQSLFTLPVHGQMSARDLSRVRAWIAADAAV